MNKKQKTILLVLSVVIVVITIFVFLYPQLQEQRSEQQRIEELEVYYPEPPEVIQETTGVVQGIRGATIITKINDPEDYILKEGQEGISQITKFVSISENTEIIGYTFSEDNNIRNKITLQLSDIKEGSRVKITTQENIRENQKITANKIELIDNIEAQ